MVCVCATCLRTHKIAFRALFYRNPPAAVGIKATNKIYAIPFCSRFQFYMTYACGAQVYDIALYLHILRFYM